jgi:hypothetical protein
MIQVVVLLSVMKAYVQIQMFIAALSVIKSQTEKKVHQQVNCSSLNPT